MVQYRRMTLFVVMVLSSTARLTATEASNIKAKKISRGIHTTNSSSIETGRFLQSCDTILPSNVTFDLFLPAMGHCTMSGMSIHHPHDLAGWVSVNATISWNVLIPQSGPYQVDYLYSRNPPSTLVNAFRLCSNLITPCFPGVTIPSTGSWFQLALISQAGLHFLEGYQAITVEALQVFWNLHSVRLKPMTTYASTPTPSQQQTGLPTDSKTLAPWNVQSAYPSLNPSSSPSKQPSIRPSSQPSLQPLLASTTSPSNHPTILPSIRPSTLPSLNPSPEPKVYPSPIPIIPVTNSPVAGIAPNSPPIVPPVTSTIAPTTTPARPSYPPLAATAAPVSGSEPIPSIQPGRSAPTTAPQGQQSSFPMPTLVPSTSAVTPTRAPASPAAVPSQTPFPSSRQPTRVPVSTQPPLNNAPSAGATVDSPSNPPTSINPDELPTQFPSNRSRDVAEEVRHSLSPSSATEELNALFSETSATLANEKEPTSIPHDWVGTATESPSFVESTLLAIIAQPMAPSSSPGTSVDGTGRTASPSPLQSSSLRSRSPMNNSLKASPMSSSDDPPESNPASATMTPTLLSREIVPGPTNSPTVSYLVRRVALGIQVTLVGVDYLDNIAIEQWRVTSESWLEDYYNEFYESLLEQIDETGMPQIRRLQRRREARTIRVELEFISQHVTYNNNGVPRNTITYNEIIMFSSHSPLSVVNPDMMRDAAFGDEKAMTELQEKLREHIPALIGVSTPVLKASRFGESNDILSPWTKSLILMGATGSTFATGLLIHSWRLSRGRYRRNWELDLSSMFFSMNTFKD